MTKTYIQERNTTWDELVQLNTENGQVKIYCVDKELGFPFSEYFSTISEMGYDSTADFIKTMNNRKTEISTDVQISKEIDGLLKLAKYRHQNNNHTCILLNDGTLYNDIVERLTVYGFTTEEAAHKIANYI